MSRLIRHRFSCIPKNVFLNDGEVAEMTRDGIETYNLDDEQVEKCVEELDWDERRPKKADTRFHAQRNF